MYTPGVNICIRPKIKESTEGKTALQTVIFLTIQLLYQGTGHFSQYTMIHKTFNNISTSLYKTKDLWFNNPIPKRRHAMENKELINWFNIHFAPSTFHGRFQIGYRKKNTTALLPLVTNEREELKKFLEKMFIRPDYDYYITANSLSGVSRKSESLFAYHNIVIDIDNHGAKNATDDPFLVKELLWRLRRDRELPAPSSYVQTGRGLQLWWAITPVHWKCQSYLKEVRHTFLQEIEEIIAEYPYLSCFSLDKTASSNDVGYFRLPFSVNTKVNNKVEIEMLTPPPCYILQDLVKKAKAWKAEIEVAERKVVSREKDDKLVEDFATNEIFVLKNVETLAFFRVKQLILLRKIRDSAINQETRNNLNFLIYNALLPVMGETLAWEKLCAFNSGFKTPMSAKELEAVIVSAKEKGGYKYTNGKIIEFLGISAEEQEKIGLFLPKTQGVQRFSQHPSRDASRALHKENRDENIRKLSKDGMTQKGIAETLGISPITVSKVLATKSGKIYQKELAMQAHEAGKPLGKVVEISGLSRSTVKRLISAGKVSS